MAKKKSRVVEEPAVEEAAQPEPQKVATQPTPAPDAAQRIDAALESVKACPRLQGADRDVLGRFVEAGTILAGRIRKRA